MAPEITYAVHPRMVKRHSTSPAAEQESGGITFLMQCCLYLQATEFTQACVNLVLLLLMQLLKKQWLSHQPQGFWDLFHIRKENICNCCTQTKRQRSHCATTLDPESCPEPCGSSAVLLLEPHCPTGRQVSLTQKCSRTSISFSSTPLTDIRWERHSMELEFQR